MKYIVTGGAGFIGSNLVNFLVGRGDQVLVVDDLSTGRLENIEGHELIKVVPSIMDARDVEVDGIFHLGMPSSSPMYRTRVAKYGPDKNIEEFYVGCEEVTCRAVKSTMEALNYARYHGVPIVYASSSSLYSGLDPPHSEDMPIAVTDFYTEARLFVERLASLYRKLYGTRSIGLRLFSVYGRNDENKGPFANVLTQFAAEIRAGRQPTIYGDGTQTRDFTHVDDVVRAFAFAMEGLMKGPEDWPLAVFNVGTGRETSFNDAVALLCGHYGRELKPAHVENPIGNYVGRTMAATERAATDLGFKAIVPLEEGIKRTYKI